MKRFSVRKKISRVQVRNATLLNLLATPGLGSLVARRWIAGVGQLALSLAGFTFVLVWFVREMIGYYGMMFSSAPEQPASKSWLVLGLGAFALAWVWTLWTCFSLHRELSRVSLESLESFAAGRMKLDETKIALALPALPQWQRRGEVIARTFQFKDFPAAMNFINAVAELAEQAQHHPDIDVRWNKVTLALTTHDAGGLTEKDFALARQCDALASR
jgi:4a-hydroxytetrahydrobiopterin dehydratase